MRKMKRVEDSRTENTYLIMNKHINSYGRLFGGVLMQWIDEMAGIVAHRHAGTIVTTACVDNLNFKAGAYLAHTVRIFHICIDPYFHGCSSHVCHLSDQDNKVEVPGLIVETEAEKAEWQGAEKRYALRKKRRIEGF